jgi:hypothetical protein
LAGQGKNRSLIRNGRREKFHKRSIAQSVTIWIISVKNFVMHPVETKQTAFALKLGLVDGRTRQTARQPAD